MSRYAEVDERIVKLISEGWNEFQHLTCFVDLMALCTPLAGEQPYWRVIDRRLQALRKAGKIKYLGNRKWGVV